MKVQASLTKSVLAFISTNLIFFGANAADSELSCLASPSDIVAATGKVLPKCAPKATPDFRSHLDPVSAVFVICSGPTKHSCLNILEGIALAKTGAKVNVLLVEALLNDAKFSSRLSAISTKASAGQLNVIPVAPTALQFLRDPFFMESQNGVPAYHNFPNPMVPKSSSIIDQAMQACGIQKADGDFENPNPVSASLIKRHFSESEAAQADQNASMGGNVLALPNGTLAIGHIDRAGKTHPEFINYLANRAKLLEVEIPALRVGHIDEIFNIAPNPQVKAGQCPFILLRASPKKMQAFLKKQNQLPPEVEQAIDSGRYTDDAADAQEIIDRSTKSLLAELSTTYKNCVPPVIDVPVLFSEGYAILPNPVNGLHVNGAYFLSAQKFPAIEKEIANTLKPYFPKGVQFIDTTQYDASLGNIHCATQNISVDCQ
ncbi:MAG: hypothetical protein JNJ49_09105 [Bdellovibrionaceae bacterium]|nr:hypothetical protein [Pseudobdellovibrionaceae bacterium]